tara:strand:- start:168 stop:326 length:159 start_codon:yes stop_codon:yes gene_type:complete
MKEDKGRREYGNTSGGSGDREASERVDVYIEKSISVCILKVEQTVMEQMSAT